MLSVENMANLSSEQELPCDRYPTSMNSTLPPWSTFAVYAGETAHKDVCNLHWNEVRRWASHRSRVYKQHIVPTASNVRAVLRAGRPIVVLVRDPLAALKADCEATLRGSTCLIKWSRHATGDRTSIQSVPPPCSRPASSQNLQRIKAVAWEERLRAARAFVDGWEQVARDNGSLLRLLRYEEMVEPGSRERAVRLVLNFFKLEPVRPFQPFYARYVHRRTEACSNALATLQRSVPRVR